MTYYIRLKEGCYLKVPTRTDEADWDIVKGEPDPFSKVTTPPLTDSFKNEVKRTLNLKRLRVPKVAYTKFYCKERSLEE